MTEPLISLFTPTHKPDDLLDVFAGIQQQRYSNWEWVLLLNNLRPDQLPHEICNHPQIKLHTYDKDNRNIGALKRAACELCRGDVLLEMDHDDMLVPGTLPKVAEAYLAGGEFIYSDVAVFEEDYRSWAYSKDANWGAYPLMVYGRRYIATRNFDITPRSLCEVYYAPDHLRAWSRKFYEHVGGHDPSLEVCDDHDLLCRSYLIGGKFAYLNCCGYLYRWHPNNTVKAKSDKIVHQSHANKKKYLTPLIREWVRRQNLGTLDVLQEKKKRPDWFACVSSLRRDGFKSGLIPEQPLGHVIASDVLQFDSGVDAYGFFELAYERMVPGGWLSVVVPSTNGLYADQNLLFKSRYNYNTFLYLSDRVFATARPDWMKCRYDLVLLDEFYPNDEFKKRNMLMTRAELCVLKDQLQPGFIKI